MKANRSGKFKTSLYITSIGLVVIGGSYYIISSLKGEFADQINFKNLRDMVNSNKICPCEEIINDLNAPLSEIVSNIQIPKLTEEYELVLEERENEKEQISDDLLRMGYEFASKDFVSLMDINEDACAWITIDGTNIDFPILNSHDESNVYYLHHDIYGNDSRVGVPYVDCRNITLENKMSDLNDITIIYGHHLKNGQMFAHLCNYKKQSFYDKHPFAVIYTPDGYAYELEFFAGHVISGADDSKLYVSGFSDENEFNDYMDNLIADSTFVSNVDVEYGDKIVALVTCSYETSNSRYVLYGRLEKQYINQKQIKNETNKVLILEER